MRLGFIWMCLIYNYIQYFVQFIRFGVSSLLSKNCQIFFSEFLIFFKFPDFYVQFVCPIFCPTFSPNCFAQLFPENFCCCRQKKSDEFFWKNFLGKKFSEKNFWKFFPGLLCIIFIPNFVPNFFAQLFRPTFSRKFLLLPAEKIG